MHTPGGSKYPHDMCSLCGHNNIMNTGNEYKPSIYTVTSEEQS